MGFELRSINNSYRLQKRRTKLSNNWYLSNMKIRNYILVSVTLLMSTLTFSQIEISEETQKDEVKPKPIKVETLLLKESTSEFFVIANWSSTNRKLVENPANGGIFADSLGTRADETSLNAWSFGIGIRDRILPYLSWEGGLTYFQNGESYLYEQADTTHSYTSTYRYIGMPVKAYYTYGNNIKFYAGGGLIPQMFIKYEQDRRWVNSVNTETTETFSTQNGYRSFVLSAVANIGVQVNMGRKVSVLFMPEYRIQLISSNVESSPHSHFARAIGFNMGLTYKL